MDIPSAVVSAPLEAVPEQFGTDTVLVVADPQNAFVDPKGSMSQLGLPTQRMRDALSHVVTLLSAAQAAGLKVVLLQMWIDDYDDAGILLAHFPPLRDLKHCAAGTWDANFTDQIVVDPSFTVVRHERFSGFHNSELEPKLRELGATSIILAGFATNTVVESTARSAFDRDLNVFIPRQATASYTPEMEQASLLNLSLGIAKVVNLDDVLTSLRKSAAVSS